MNSQTKSHADTILDVQKVTVSFDGFKALDGLDFSIKKGELRFVIGPNGAGKTTLLDVATGKTRPATGKVLFNGSVDVAHEMEHTLVRKGLGRKFQTPSVFASLSVYENLEAAIGFNDPTLSLLRGVTAEEEALIHDTLDNRARPSRGPGAPPAPSGSPPPCGSPCRWRPACASPPRATRRRGARPARPSPGTSS